MQAGWLVIGGWPAQSRRTGTVGDSIRSSNVAMASQRACSAAAAMIASGIGARTRGVTSGWRRRSRPVGVHQFDAVTGEEPDQGLPNAGFLDPCLPA